MDDLVTRVWYRERYGNPTLHDETEVRKKESVLWNSQEECTVFCTGKHNICHMKDNLSVMYFSTQIRMLLEIARITHSFCMTEFFKIQF
jgi:hypothetical protein